MCIVDFEKPAAVYFARPDALKGTLKETLIEAKPTVFFAVPRVWEKFAEAMQAKGKEITGLKAKISAFMKGKCAGVHAASQVGATVGYPFLGGFAMKFMKKKAHAAIGLDQARVCLTGAAPIMKHTLDYFGTIGIHILEVYGMSRKHWSAKRVQVRLLQSRVLRRPDSGRRDQARPRPGARQGWRR